MAILRYALPPLSLGTDNAEVVRGWECGPLYCSNPAKEGADLWRMVWEKVGDVGKEGLTVYKVKAHLGEEAVEQGRISWVDWVGNGEADRLAVMGAEKAAQISPNEGCDQQLKRATEYYKWISQYTNAWADDTRREEEVRGAAGGGSNALKFIKICSFSTILVAFYTKFRGDSEFDNESR